MGLDDLKEEDIVNSMMKLLGETESTSLSPWVSPTKNSKSEMRPVSSRCLAQSKGARFADCQSTSTGLFILSLKLREKLIDRVKHRRH